MVIGGLQAGQSLSQDSAGAGRLSEVLGPVCVLLSSRLHHLELAVWICSPGGGSLLGNRLGKH